MADFVNQVLMQQRRSGGDPQGEAIARNSAALGQTLMQQAQMRMNQQQSDAAMRQREMNEGLTVLGLDWVPVEDKVRVANKLGQQFGLQGSITADGLNPYRQLLTDMKKDVDDGKDLSRWSSAVELFSANPQFVEPQMRPSVLQAQQQIQEQKVQNVAGQQFPSVEDGPEAMSRTQEARGRLALFDSIKPDDPESAQKLEAFTKVYGSAERLQQQIESDKLIVQDEEERLRKRDQYAAALRMAPAELAKQTAAAIDPKTILLPTISRAIQEKGIDGLDETERKALEAHYVINGQPDKLALFSEGAKVNELKRYQQDLEESKMQTGMIDQVQKVMQVGKERIDTYTAAAQDALASIEARGSKMPTDSYEQRQETLKQLETATQAAVTDWEQTVEPIRQELSNGKATALATVQDLNKKMSRPGVDRVTLGKRRDFYQQMADTYDLMNRSLGMQSDMDLALKRNELKALEIEAKTGPDEQQSSAQALLPKKQAELNALERQVEQNAMQINLAKERLTRMGKLSQARITAADKKLEQQQQNGDMASAFLGEWANGGFKASPDQWFAENAKHFPGADPKLFMEVVKPALDNRKQIQQGLAESELLRSGNAKDAGKIAAKYGVKPSDILDVLKDPNKPMVTIENKQESASAKKIGEGLGEEYNALQKGAVASQQQLAKLDRMDQLLSGIETGSLTPTLTQVQGIASALGFQVDPSLPAKQAFSALTNELALNLRNPAGGAGMPGALSDKDREFLQQMTPSLAQTKEGNKMILEASKRLAKRNVEVAKLARDYKKRNGGNFDDGFFDELQTYADKNPLFQSLPGQVPTVKSEAEYNQLPSGAVYLDPNGVKRKKP